MSSFIGAALPWVGGKVSDLLGRTQREGDEDGVLVEDNGVRAAAAAAAAVGNTAVSPRQHHQHHPHQRGVSGPRAGAGAGAQGNGFLTSSTSSPLAAPRRDSGTSAVVAFGKGSGTVTVTGTAASAATAGNSSGIAAVTPSFSSKRGSRVSSAAAAGAAGAAGAVAAASSPVPVAVPRSGRGSAASDRASGNPAVFGKERRRGSTGGGRGNGSGGGGVSGGDSRGAPVRRVRNRIPGDVEVGVGGDGWSGGGGRGRGRSGSEGNGSSCTRSSGDASTTSTTATANDAPGAWTRGRDRRGLPSPSPPPPPSLATTAAPPATVRGRRSSSGSASRAPMASSSWDSGNARGGSSVPPAAPPARGVPARAASAGGGGSGGGGAGVGAETGGASAGKKRRAGAAGVSSPLGIKRRTAAAVEAAPVGGAGGRRGGGAGVEGGRRGDTNGVGCSAEEGRRGASGGPERPPYGRSSASTDERSTERSSSERCFFERSPSKRSSTERSTDWSGGGCGGGGVAGGGRGVARARESEETPGRCKGRSCCMLADSGKGGGGRRAVEGGGDLGNGDDKHPSIETQMRAAEAAKHVQTERLLTRSSSSASASASPSPHPLPRKSGTGSCHEMASGSQRLLSPAVPPWSMCGNRGGGAGSSSISGSDGPRFGGYSGSLIANGGGGDAWRRPAQLQVQGQTHVLGHGQGQVQEQLQGRECPVFSNGVLVPRPFLWAGRGRRQDGGGGSGAAGGAGVLGRADGGGGRSYVGGADGDVDGHRGGGGGVTGGRGLDARGFSGGREGFRGDHRYYGHASGNGSGSCPGTGPSTGGGVPAGDEFIERRSYPSAMSSLPRESNTPRGGSITASGTSANINGGAFHPAGGVEAGAGAGGAGAARLAWCGDQRLLSRPSATLQLRRPAPLSSPATAATGSCSGSRSGSGSGSKSGSGSRLASAEQSIAAAEYLGRLDLTADVAGAGGSVRGGPAWGGVRGLYPVVPSGVSVAASGVSVGAHGVGVAGGSVGGGSSGGGDGGCTAAPRYPRPLDGEGVDVGVGGAGDEGDGGDGGKDRGFVGVGVDGRVSRSSGTGSTSRSGDEGVTMSSSGLSVTSGEGSDTESDTDEVFMVVDDRDDPDYAYGAFSEDLEGQEMADAPCAKSSASTGGKPEGETDGGACAVSSSSSSSPSPSLSALAEEACTTAPEAMPVGENREPAVEVAGTGASAASFKPACAPPKAGDAPAPAAAAGGDGEQADTAAVNSATGSVPTTTAVGNGPAVPGVTAPAPPRDGARSHKKRKAPRWGKGKRRKSTPSAASTLGMGTGIGTGIATSTRASPGNRSGTGGASDAGSATSELKKIPRVKAPRARAAAIEPLVPPPPPDVPRKWPARPPNRALVYAAAAEASRRARGFTGWSFPALPPPPPPPPPPPSPPRVATPPPVCEPVEVVPPVAVAEDESVPVESAVSGGGGGGKSKGKGKGRVVPENDVFLGLAKDNPPGKPSPNLFGWSPLDPMHTAEGRAAVKQRALERKRRAIELIARRKREELERRRLELERIALQKRQEILDALRIKEEIAEARRKRKLNILFLGMTRVAEYDSRGGLTKGMKRFDLVERMVRGDVDETNMNPLRDTARVLAMEALGHEVRCISKVSTPGESDSERSRSTRAKGGPTGLGRFLATDMTNTGASRGFLRRIEEKWEDITFDTILLDHYWLPDSVVWLNKGYMANDGGLIQNLVRMTTTRLLRDDFEIMLPINQAFFELLLPHFHDLETHFTVEFLVGERLEHLKRSHLALEADDLIPAEVMLNIYGKEREHQVSQMLGVKQPTAEVAAILLKYGVATQHFCYARFLKLSRNPPPHPALAAIALTAASESAKIAEESAKVAAESAKMAAEAASISEQSARATTEAEIEKIRSEIDVASLSSGVGGASSGSSSAA